MMAALLILELVILAGLQATWWVYYNRAYRWQDTPLGPVWLAKGGLLALLWPLLAVNEFWSVPTWVWTLILGPGLIAATAWWLVVTVRAPSPPRRD